MKITQRNILKVTALCRKGSVINCSSNLCFSPNASEIHLALNCHVASSLKTAVNSYDASNFSASQ